MFKALILSLIVYIGVTPIYDIRIKSIDGKKIDFSSFKGKKILIANIALDSRYVVQLEGLEKLQQKYKERLVVIGVPSSGFGKEDLDKDEFIRKLRQEYQVSFLIAEKMKVKGADKSALYQWLQEGNGRMKKQVTDDFHKYLIDTNGELMGHFIPAVDPMSEIVQNAIEGKANN